jgi:hypothetical protein
MTPRMMRWPLMCSAALLISCAPSAPVPVVQIQRLAPPAALLVCAEAPPVPARAGLTQGRVAELLLALGAAHADCEGKLRAVRAWVAEAGQ